MIFYIKNVYDIPSEEIAQIYNTMPELRKNRVDSLKMEADRLNSIVAWSLVKKGMAHFGVNADDYEYAIADSGKPYLVGCSYCFSISHSDKMVAVSVCDNEVGIDVQMVVDDYERVARKICTPNELAIINDKYSFAKIWTHKEATVKCTSAGIRDMIKYDFSKEYDPQFDYNVINNENYCIVECKKVGD